MLASLPGSRPNPWAIGTAVVLNGIVLALLLSLRAHNTAGHPLTSLHAPVVLSDLPFFVARPSNGGTGGGQRDAMEAMRGRPPRTDRMPLAPPQIPVLEHPRLAIDNTVAVPVSVRLPDDPSLSNIGVLHSANAVVFSGGRGGMAGIGDGNGRGYGNGRGDGFGSGDGDGIAIPGQGGVSAPVAISTPEAEFSDEARRQKFQGICIVAVIVDIHGVPRNPRIVQPLGMGLDEKALEAVARYRFRPALRNGKPVAARMNVAINFRLIY